MNLNISIFLIFFILVGNVFSADRALEEIARKAILSSGYLTPEYLYISKDENLKEEGKIFFESKKLSLNGNISCLTCHIAKKGSSDGIPNAAGIYGTGESGERIKSGALIVPRNTLALWGVGSKGFETFFWDGRVDFSNEKNISQFGSHQPSEDPLITAVHLPVVEIRETLDEDSFVLKHKLESLGGAKNLFEAIVYKLKTEEKEAITSLAEKLNKTVVEIKFIDIARSLASFIRNEFKLKSTKFDKFVEGKISLSNKELNGALIFYGKGGCSSCHSGSHFTNFNFYTIPLPQLGFGKNGFGIDYGRYNTTFNPKDLYKFRTPSLRNVDKTGPYGHSGSAKNLREAIIYHYDPLSLLDIDKYNSLQRHEYYKYLVKSDTANIINFLSMREVNDLESFLKTLSQ
jgi:cytochrome c peroxidase